MATRVPSGLPAFRLGIGRHVSEEQHLGLLDAVLSFEVAGYPLGPTRWSKTVTREARRLARLAASASDFHGTESLGTWCLQNGLTRSDQTRSPAGLALMELVGRDAVELALALGVELSVGPEDRWRLCRAGLEALLAEEQVYDEDLDWVSPYARQPMARLASMGIAQHVTREDDPCWDRFRLHDDARDLVRRVAEEPDGRFRALARTLIELERGRVSVATTGRGAPDRTDLHYARSVAHEIRNLVLPLATSVDALWEELGRAEVDVARRQQLRGRITRSMDRISEFANEAVRLSAAVAEETFALAEVVGEGVRATEVERNGRIAVHADGLGDSRLYGARRDWIGAFLNLFRNAAQVRADRGAVWVSVVRDEVGGMHVYVDDDGPGVPEELRERIFEPGHSTRGGSGLGLAEARRAALLAGGTLACETSPRGGARFHFSLPARSAR